MRKQQKYRIDQEVGLQVDTKNASNQPLISRIGQPLDFLETRDGVGAVALCFTINDFATGTGYGILKLVGTANDEAGKYRNGWYLGVEKSAGGAYFWSGNYGTGNNYIVNVCTAGIQQGKTYWLFLFKAAAGASQIYIGTTKPPQYYEAPGSPEITTNPVTFGNGTLDGAPQAGVFTIHHFSVYSGATDLNLINQTVNGNWIQKSLAAPCVAYYPFQEKSGAYAYDRVSQFNWAKNAGTYFTELTGSVYTPDVGGWIGSNGGTIAPSSTDNINMQHNGIPGATFTNIVTLTKVLSNIELWFYRPWNVNFTLNLRNASTNTLLKTIEVEIPNALENVYWDFENIGAGTYKIELIYNNYNGGTPYILFSKTTITEQKLTGNHIELLGYDPADLLANGSARRNLIDGSQYTYLDGSSLEIKTGLPEIKKAILADETTTVIPNGGIEDFLDYGNYTFIVAGYYPGAGYSQRVLSYYKYGVIDLRISLGNIIAYMGETGGYFIANIPGGGLVPGNMLFTFSRAGVNAFSATYNGMPLEFMGGWAPGSYANPFRVKYATYPDLTFTDTDTLTLNNVIGGYHIFAAVKRGAMSGVDALNLFSNGRFTNPADLVNYARFYPLGLFDTSGFVADLTGNGAALDTKYSGANAIYYTNPAHAWYVGKELNTLI